MAKKLTAKQIKILCDIASALRNQNIKVSVETLNSKINGNRIYSKNSPQSPEKRKSWNGAVSRNRQYAESIKLGPDISIKRIRIPPAPTGKKDGFGQEIYIERGWYYLARTPSGEAKFTDMDRDFATLWGAALRDYDDGWGKSYGPLNRNLVNEELRKIISGPATPKTGKSKLEESKARLKKLGVTKGQISGVVKADDIAKAKILTGKKR